MQHRTLNKPRILILTVGFTIGGAEKIIFNVSRALRRDFDFYVVALKRDGSLRPIFEKEGIKTFSLGGKFPFDFRLFFSLNLLVKKIKPHIIHSHLLKANWIGRIIAYINKIPEISTIHTVSTLLNPIEVLLERYTAHLASVNICCSKYVALNNTARIKHPFNYYIYNGIEIRDAFSPKKINPYKLVVVSRINLRQKALIELVEAISILNKNGHKFAVDIYGEGSDMALLLLKERIKKYCLDKIVILRGFTSHPETILSRYSVFILPSKTEGLPISILEAILSGLVVVASDIGGISEIIEDGATGFLIDGYSPENIAKTLLRIVAMKNDLPRITLNARRKLETTFDIAKTVLYWKKLYSFVLQHNSVEGLSNIIPHV
jgi:glycosyltransferase involved in cell wall biosynthesis